MNAMQFEHKVLNVGWLRTLDKEQLDRVLLEYELISSSFVPWLLFVMANAEDERVRQLLLPNLNEEAGEFRKNNSHHALYLKMIKSFGLEPDGYAHADFTVKARCAFSHIFKGADTYKSLCVMGPAIEAISSDFLFPMYKVVRKHYKESTQTIYFPLHLSEMEDAHAGNIEEAICLMEKGSPRLNAKKIKYVHEGITIFETFWEDLRRAVKADED